MPQIVLNVSPELNSRVNFWGSRGNETPEQLTLRLLEEYVEDCEDAEKISAEIDAGRMKTYDWHDVRGNLGFDD